MLLSKPSAPAHKTGERRPEALTRRDHHNIRTRLVPSCLFAPVKASLATKSVPRLQGRSLVVSDTDALAGASMDTLVNIAFKLWFGGVAAYSIARLTWCLRGAFAACLQCLIATNP